MLRLFITFPNWSPTYPTWTYLIRNSIGIRFACKKNHSYVLKFIELLLLLLFCCCIQLNPRVGIDRDYRCEYHNCVCNKSITEFNENKCGDHTSRASVCVLLARTPVANAIGTKKRHQRRGRRRLQRIKTITMNVSAMSDVNFVLHSWRHQLRTVWTTNQIECMLRSVRSDDLSESG